MHLVHLLTLGGQLDPTNIMGNSIIFVRSNCSEVFKVLAASVCCYEHFELKCFIYLYKHVCVSFVDCICHWIII